MAIVICRIGYCSGSAGERTLLGSGSIGYGFLANDSPDERIVLRYIPSAQATVGNLAFDPYMLK